MTKRKLPSFIEGFMHYMKDSYSPTLLTKWGAIWAVAAAMQRRTYVFTLNKPLYPNLYVMLVSPPGLGKTQVTNTLYDLFSVFGDNRLAPSNVTYASIISDLREAESPMIDKEKQRNITINSLAIISDEMQVILPSYDTMIIGKLTHLYDCLPYSESRKTSRKENSFNIPYPQVNMIACAQPAYIMGTMPESAWNLGFLSRTFLVYSTERRPVESLFVVAETDKDLWKNLEYDIQMIGRLHGKFLFSEEAKESINNFARQGVYGGKPIPSHPRLLNYATRRTAHMLKLMQVSCADRAEGNMEILVEDFDRAYEWLIEMETNVPEIFKEASADSDQKVALDLLHALNRLYVKNGEEPISQQLVWQYLSTKVQANKAKGLLETMENAGYLISKVHKGKPAYVPQLPKDMFTE